MTRIGTSGYSYNEWKGQFYPKSCKSSDMLNTYGEYFNTVELSTTYFSIPAKEMFFHMARKVPKDFKFCIKANKSITLERNTDIIIPMMAAISPIIENGQLGCIILQIPRSMKPSLENQEFILKVKNMIDQPMLLEIRAPEWTRDDAIDATFRFLEENSLGYLIIDEPKGASFIKEVPRISSKIGGIRFHGRNSEKWFSQGNPGEKYDYSYSEEELLEWKKKIEALSSLTEEFFILFQNYPNARSVTNAVKLKELLGLGKTNLPEGEGFDSDLKNFLK